MYNHKVSNYLLFIKNKQTEREKAFISISYLFQ